jgi:hypothetical protein
MLWAPNMRASAIRHLVPCADSEEVNLEMMEREECDNRKWVSRERMCRYLGGLKIWLANEGDKDVKSC